MERLTKYLASGVAAYDYPESSNCFCDRVSKSAYRQRCVERLAAYEDTGLTPESVEALKLSVMGKAVSEITEFEGLPIAHLKELARADREGRVVVYDTREEAEEALRRFENGT